MTNRNLSPSILQADCMCVCVCVYVCVCVCVCVLSCVQLFVTPWTVAYQSLLSMGFHRQEYRKGLPFPTPGNLSHPGIKPESLLSPALTDGFFTNFLTWETKRLISKLNFICNLNSPLPCNVAYSRTKSCASEICSGEAP